MKKPSNTFLLARIRAWTTFFIIALMVSGLTAIPLRPELNLLVGIFAQNHPPTALGAWLLNVQAAINTVSDQYPFLALGTDWLAFGHVAIALGFIGLLRDPLRNDWLITWGILLCLLVLPWAWCFGWARGIPWGWRLIDCSFGVGGLIPLLLIRRDVIKLKRPPHTARKIQTADLKLENKRETAKTFALFSFTQASLIRQTASSWPRDQKVSMPKNAYFWTPMHLVRWKILNP